MKTDIKILSEKTLAARVNELHDAGKCIVTCNGSFDLFHFGHLYFLSYARACGDALIVGLNSDASIKRYKSPDRPIVCEAQRASVIAALECVTYVHIFDDDVPMPFLEIVKPDVHVNGAEYGEDCIEAPTIKAHGGKISLVPKVEGLSTTELIARIKNCAG